MLIARLDQVHFGYGTHTIFAGLGLSLNDGEKVGLVGPNGAGKSTLLSILAGALAPSEGRVEAGEPPARVGWVPQRPAHYGRLTPGENLELFARLERVPDPDEAVGRMLALVDLPRDGKPAAHLSAGNQQRLNLAIALLPDPDVLLLDEPTASLDAAQRRRVWELALAVRSRGGAVAFATQALDEVERFADAVAALEGGRIVFHGPLEAYERAPEARVFAV